MTETPAKYLDIDKLEFPAQLVDAIGLSKNEIGFMRRKGCLFVGKKTTVRWVRMHLAREAGSDELASSLYGHPLYVGQTPLPAKFPEPIQG